MGIEIGKKLLILSIGGNPLPNYVVSKYFLSLDRSLEHNIDAVLMIHSTKTEIYADSIISQLISEGTITDRKFCFKVDLEDNERDINTIDEKLEEKLHEISDENDGINAINLNYTGGTKPMIMQSYITTKNFCEINKISLFLSDLDPNNFKISLKNDDFLIFLPQNGDLRDIVRLDLEGLLNLHQMERGAPSREGSRYYNENYVQNLFYDSEIVKNWYYLQNSERGKKIPNIPPKNAPVKIRRELNFNYYLDSLDNLMIPNNGFIKTFDTRPGHDNKMKHIWYIVSKFITSGWFELFVFKTTQNLENVNFSGLEINFYASFKNRPTEIDVIAIRGYQLYVISVTTIRNKLQRVKLKCFEALYRAEQLGGLHAKAIVISLLPQDKILEINRDLSEFKAAQNSYLIGIDATELEFKRLANEPLTPEEIGRSLSKRLENYFIYGRKLE